MSEPETGGGAGAAEAAAPVPPVATTTVEERWRQFFRWGPYGLFAVGAALVAASADEIMTARRVAFAVALGAALLLLQLWWTRHQTVAAARPATADTRTAGAVTADAGAAQAVTAAEALAARDAGAPVSLLPGAPGPAATCYFVLRSALAFALTWLNPFFAVFACIGYFDAHHLLPRRPVVTRAGLLAVALTLSGSQSGGLPPRSTMQWVAFGGLFALNAGLAVGLSHLGEKEAEKARTLVETNVRLERALAENAALQAQLLVQAREAGVADERRRLAAEIHDTIAQGLAGIITQLQVVTVTTDPEVAGTHLRRAADLARHSLGEARRSVRDLSPVALEHDALPRALAKTVTAWSERTGIDARFTVTGTELPLHGEIEASLLRIAQEALANAERHSGAARAGVTLSYMGDEITLDVRDDGRGFTADAVPAPSRAGGFGLGGMRARAERLAGRLTVESEPGHGTAISARVPLTGDNDEDNGDGGATTAAMGDDGR
ncbi:sensor histidine kinase [Streptomyces sp. NPDC090025]|uniref:sensor histidine kinase n=1 Tax=Streptomyces sp. NPDC090025 TaxID=3365922 RepID=UPI003834D532